MERKKRGVWRKRVRGGSSRCVEIGTYLDNTGPLLPA